MPYNVWDKQFTMWGIRCVGELQFVLFGFFVLLNYSHPLRDSSCRGEGEVVYYTNEIN